MKMKNTTTSAQNNLRQGRIESTSVQEEISIEKLLQLLNLLKNQSPYQKNPDLDTEIKKLEKAGYHNEESIEQLIEQYYSSQYDEDDLDNPELSEERITQIHDIIDESYKYQKIFHHYKTLLYHSGIVREDVRDEASNNILTKYRPNLDKIEEISEVDSVYSASDMLVNHEIEISGNNAEQHD